MLTRAARRRFTLAIEVLENRVVPSTVTVHMDPSLDQFGAQIQTVQAYNSAAQATFGILDTGASPVTFSADDQATFTSLGVPIPVIPNATAQAGGIGGNITGDVSKPGTIIADGVHVATLQFDSLGFPYYTVDLSASKSTPGIQAFIGTYGGSPLLPTVTGTPVFNASSSNPGGLAARIDLQGFTVDLSSLLPGLVVSEPDVHFVSPSSTIAQATGTTAPVKIPLSFYGTDNHTNPNMDVTSSVNPMDKNVRLTDNGVTLTNQSFLLDTGSQLTVISTAEANALHLDLAHPQTTLDVQGVGGTVTVPGFTLSSLCVPTTTGTLKFTNVPVYVLDVAPDISGLLGMNLFNLGASMLYNPYGTGGPSLTVTFYTDPNMDSGGGLGGLFMLHSNPVVSLISGLSGPAGVESSQFQDLKYSLDAERSLSGLLSQLLAMNRADIGLAAQAGGVRANHGSEAPPDLHAATGLLAFPGLQQSPLTLPNTPEYASSPPDRALISVAGQASVVTAKTEAPVGPAARDTAEPADSDSLLDRIGATLTTQDDWALPPLAGESEPDAELLFRGTPLTTSDAGLSETTQDLDLFTELAVVLVGSLGFKLKECSLESTRDDNRLVKGGRY
jgi:hypothetical protein